VLDDPARNAELLAWADKQIFSRDFKDADYSDLQSPEIARGGGNFNLHRAGVSPPSWMKGWATKGIGHDWAHPDIVFVGKGSGQGIIITRGEFDAYLKRTEVEPSRIEHRKNRMAMICYM
jgi:hypothetical protein